MVSKVKATLIIAALMASMSLVALASGASVTPTLYPSWTSGNGIAEANGLGYGFGYKIDSWDQNHGMDGTYDVEFTPPGGDPIKFTITISNSDGDSFDWASTYPIGAVMVKAGTGYNVYYYEPQAMFNLDLIAYEGKGVSHVTFCWNPDQTAAAEWCSPGYWRQDHHLDSWEATGYKITDLFSEALDYDVTLSKQGVRANADPNPTLLMVLQSPQYYGGDAFNAVGDLLSAAHPDVNFNGERIEDSCPLN